MFNPFIAASNEANPQWLTIALSLGGGSLFTGLLAWWADRSKRADERRTRRETDNRDDRKERTAADANLEVERLKIQHTEREQYMAEIRRFNERHETTERELRGQIEQMRTDMNDKVRTMGHEVRNLRNQVNMTQGVYHELYGFTSNLALELKHNRARLKRLMDASGEKYTEDEFPSIDVTPFDPKRLFPQFGAKDAAQFMSSKSTTARIEILGTDE